jgi:hypothetical protein
MPERQETPPAAPGTLPARPETEVVESAGSRHILLWLSWLWVLLAGIAACLLLLRTLVATQNPNFLPSLILFGSTVVPATVLTFATTGGRRSLAALDDTLLLRALLAPAGHVAWTGLAMAAIGRIRGTAHRGRAIFVAIGVFVAVVILHAVWDASSSLIIRIVVALLSFGA